MRSSSIYWQRLAVYVGVLLLSIQAVVAAEPQRLKGHVPAQVRGAVAVGRLAPATNLNLAIGLPLRDPAGLAEFLRQLQDPASSNFRKYVTPEQFAERFGPTEQDYEAVVAFAQANGLKVTAHHTNRLVVSVRGSAGDIERALHVTLREYQHPKEARLYHAPDVEPSLDLSVPILHVSGLDDFAIPRPMHRRQRAPATAQATPNGGSYLGSLYGGTDFRTAYVPGTTLNGNGQSVGLLQFDGYTASDITYYESHVGLPNVPLQNVLIDGATGGPSGSGGEFEVSLDIEMVAAMAPGVSKIYVYMAPNPSPWVDLLSRMANDNLSKQLSCSWGGGSANSSAETIFLQMAAQGQTFFNASGDSDAFTSAIPFPADSTNIVQVGGTTLTTGSGSTYSSEAVWNSGSGVGSSGGISTYYAIPGYQQGISMTANHGSTSMRNVPDVAMVATQIYVRANGGNYLMSGTSCAAPLWAGFMSLVNQQAAISGVSPLGFLNPALYAIGKGASYAANFHDVTSGNNNSASSPVNYPAVTGYDLCTGWGSPNGTNLINTLMSLSALHVLPVSTLSYSGPVGGPFSPASYSLILSNAGLVSVPWSLSTTSAWITTSTTNGTLVAGGVTNITIALASQATNLAAQTYSGNIFIVDQTDGSLQVRTVTLQVNDPLQITILSSLSFSGPPGGAFTPASGSLQLTNVGFSTVSWSAGSTCSWFRISPASGSLPTGGAARVTISLASAATGLVAQAYAGTAWFTNNQAATSQGIPVGLTVLGPQAVINGGFETGAVAPWSSTGYNAVLNKNLTYNTGTILGTDYVRSGTYGMYFGNPVTFGILSQSLQTAAGRPYLLSFWLQNPYYNLPG